MEFPMKEYWSGLPFPSPGNLPNPGIKPMSPAFPALQVDSLPLSHRGSSGFFGFWVIFFFPSSCSAVPFPLIFYISHKYVWVYCYVFCLRCVVFLFICDISFLNKCWKILNHDLLKWLLLPQVHLPPGTLIRGYQTCSWTLWYISAPFVISISCLLTSQCCKMYHF